MPTSFYDVVVLGTRLEPLLCAALLAREGLRVLVLGQGVPEPFYRLAGVEIEPYGLTMAGAQSPIVQSTLEDLALRQDVRQRMADRDSVFQLLLPEHRLDVYPEADRWLAELGREFASVRRQGTDITRTLAEVRSELDSIGKDKVGHRGTSSRCGTPCGRRSRRFFPTSQAWSPRSMRIPLARGCTATLCWAWVSSVAVGPGSERRYSRAFGLGAAM